MSYLVNEILTTLISSDQFGLHRVQVWTNHFCCACAWFSFGFRGFRWLLSPPSSPPSFSYAFSSPLSLANQFFLFLSVSQLVHWSIGRLFLCLFLLLRFINALLHWRFVNLIAF